MQCKNEHDAGGQYGKKWLQWLIGWSAVAFCEALGQRRLPKTDLEEAIRP